MPPRRGNATLNAAGAAMIVLLLLLSLVVDLLMGLFSIGTARVPMLWLFHWHPALILVALSAVVWQRRDPTVWGFALAVGLLPVVAVALMLVL